NLSDRMADQHQDFSMTDDHLVSQARWNPTGTPLHIPVDDGSDEPGSEASDAKSTPTVEGGSSLSHYFEIYSSQL
ncbi:hypothetical protein E2320_002656, partial [Naja naja]